MQTPLIIYNSLSRKKEEFKPLNAPFVGLYLCGPTVYGDAHLGHARSAIAFDLVFRYLKHLGYKVRYVRNITDVGHLENDADFGEDKIGKKAKIEQLEPMEVVQHYMDAYVADLDQLNALRPSIQPRASAHIPEQIKMIEKILENDLAYVVNGSVYFDVLKYNEKFHYGELSGRILEDLIAGAGNERRELEGQEEKRNAVDFALWKKAAPEHIMRWESPWSDGFPGWHIECSAMSTKYLGEQFDIHGGGMDLLFPHHECEIAQSKSCTHKQPVNYWMHNNMVTINGQKMGKSLGNSINLKDFFSGNHPALHKAYSPMTIRFFMLQAHYRSTLDFSNEALEASEKGMKRLLAAWALLSKISAKAKSTFDVMAWKNRCYAAMNDDFNSPILIAEMFDAARLINLMQDDKESLTELDLLTFNATFTVFIEDVLGLKMENSGAGNTDKLIQIMIELRASAKQNKDYATSDAIRDKLLEAGFQLKDGKDGTTWSEV